METTRPHRIKGNPTADGDFVVFEHVALFDEHTGDDGVVYDERLLQRIAENCNQRIRTTGDFCPAVVGHTRDNEDKRHANDDPPVIGLAGPFYVGDWVNGEAQPVKCIFATFWVFPDCEQTFLRNPRRSVEVWPEDKPENRYFDPISLLGSETPKRDLGMLYGKGYSVGGPLRYSKRRVGKLRYQEAMASVPGGNNTFIPGPVKKRQHAKDSDTPDSRADLTPDIDVGHGDSATRYKESGMTLSQDDLQQIIEAMRPIVEAQVDAALPTGGGDPGAEDALIPETEELGMPAPEPEQIETAEIGGEATGLDSIPEEPAMNDDEKAYANALYRKFMKYAKAGDDEGCGKYMACLDEDDRKHMKYAMQYMCDDKDAQKYAQQYALFGDDQAMSYDKSPIGGDDITEKPGDSKPSGSMDASEHKPGKATVQKNSKAEGSKVTTETQEVETVETAETVEVETQELETAGAPDEKQRYAKTVAENRELKTELTDLKQKYAKHEEQFQKLQVKERYAKRQARLIEKESEGYVLEVEDELSSTESMSDEQFDFHVDTRIPQRYQKMPQEMVDLGQQKPPKMGSDSPRAKQDRYAKTAGEIAEKYRKSGRRVTSNEYGKILDVLVDNDGKFDEESHGSKVFAGNGAV